MSVDPAEVITHITIEEIETDVSVDGDAIGVVTSEGERTVLVVPGPPPAVVEAATPTTIVLPTETDVAVVSVGIVGPAGPQGPAGPSGGALQAYAHDQSVPASTWTINHSLGFRPGGVLVIDTLGRVVVGEISHPTVNQTVLTFTAAFSGAAYLS